MLSPTPKRPFELPLAIERIRLAVQPYPKAALFELFGLGYSTPFEQLLACMISIRTRDEVTLPAARRLFEHARSPAAIAALEPGEIERLIYPSTFHERKAIQMRTLARRVQDEFGGELPCDPEIMMTFSGVGLKCANLAAGIACGAARVSADIHVHRITNRWGYVATRSSEATSAALEAILPAEYYIEINALLVPFGKHICTGVAPHCSTCPVLEMCRQVGVTQHR